MLRDVIFDIGNPEKLSGEELETGIQILTDYIEGCEKAKSKGQTRLRNTESQVVERDSAVRLYDDRINSARKMRKDYQDRLR